MTSTQTVQHWLNAQDLPPRLVRKDTLDSHVHSVGPVHPVELLLRTASACLASSILTTSALSLVLVRATSPRSIGTGLDLGLSWTMGVPVASVAVLWEWSRQGYMLGWWMTRRGAFSCLQDPRRSAMLLTADILLEVLLALGAAICAFLAAFQAARHAAFNRRSVDDQLYRDVGVNIALTVLLVFLMLSSFGILTLALVEANGRRHSSRSSNSSVIEIIRPREG